MKTREVVFYSEGAKMVGDIYMGCRFSVAHELDRILEFAKVIAWLKFCVRA